MSTSSMWNLLYAGAKTPGDLEPLVEVALTNPSLVDRENMYGLVIDPRLPVAYLRRFALSPDEGIRLRVVVNPNTPNELGCEVITSLEEATLQKLVGDQIGALDPVLEKALFERLTSVGVMLTILERHMNEAEWDRYEVDSVVVTALAEVLLDKISRTDASKSEQVIYSEILADLVKREGRSMTAEVLRRLPVSVLVEVGEKSEVANLLLEFMKDELGGDHTLWHRMLGLSVDWPGSVGDLIKAARRV